MRFKLIIALVEDDKSDKALKAAREAGATGATIVTNARGEGVEHKKTFFGLGLESQRDVLFFLVEEQSSRHILEKISEVGNFDTSPGTGIAFQIDVEDALGVKHQVQTILEAKKDQPV